ncbi:MAG: hypothetical protein WDN08_21150 [Rhizomicrobium sp.]
MKRVVVVLSAGALLSLSAAAQVPAVPPLPGTPPPAAPPVHLTPPLGAAPFVAAPAQRYRGTIAELNGPFLTIKTADRKSITLGVTMATRVIHNRMLKLADLQPGWYVAALVLQGTDGKLRAQGVRVYPANMPRPERRRLSQRSRQSDAPDRRRHRDRGDARRHRRGSRGCLSRRRGAAGR